jgi:SAM-dependent methyltransferase
MEYKRCFENRVFQYKYAIRIYPFVMVDEHAAIIARLDLFDGCRVLDIGDSGFGAGLGGVGVSIDFEFENLPFESRSFDRIVILAVLHHVSVEERAVLYKECMRLLVPGGRLVIADVISDSIQDYWLNGIVNRYNSNGHCGVFFDESDAQLIRSVGFDVECERVSYHWYFRNLVEMEDFIINLFGMDLLGPGENLYDIVNENLGLLGEEGREVKFEWQLIFFVSTSPLDYIPSDPIVPDYHQPV